MTGLPDRLAGDFLRASEARLWLAAGMYEVGGGLPFSDRFIEMANVAMLVWSAGIDLISVHMLLNGDRGLGTSASRRRYLLNQIVPANRQLRLEIGWRGLSRLHNFQHNLDLRVAEFATNCRDSALFFEDLNGLLSAPLRLESATYGWLAEMS